MDCSTKTKHAQHFHKVLSTASCTITVHALARSRQCRWVPSPAHLAFNAPYKCPYKCPQRPGPSSSCLPLHKGTVGRCWGFHDARQRATLALGRHRSLFGAMISSTHATCLLFRPHHRERRASMGCACMHEGAACAYKRVMFSRAHRVTEAGVLSTECCRTPTRAICFSYHPAPIMFVIPRRMFRNSPSSRSATVQVSALAELAQSPQHYPA